MKRIYINENTISNVLKKRLLPQFLFKMIKAHETSLGDSEAFPNHEEYPFDYLLLKKRYDDVCNVIESYGFESLDEDSLMSELSLCVRECKELEKPIRDSLEKICENALNRLFAIPDEMINFKLKLVDKVTFDNGIRMTPESNEEVKYSFKDISDIDFSKKVIEKRRFINALIQGASYIYSKIDGLYVDELDKINPELYRLYRKIIAINDYLLFIKKEEMSDDKPMQGSYVSVRLGSDIKRTTIEAQGIIFPLLLHDAIKGLFELFSTYGLPKDKEKAQYIIKKADFLLAEPWDLRLGVGLWENIFGKVEDTNMIPYMFTSFVKIPTDEFNSSVKEILSSTEKGQMIINDLIKNAEYDNGYQQFTNRINARNLDKSLIKDSYFNGAETNGYEIDSDGGESDVIEEDEENSPNIETWFRGLCGKFDQLKNKQCIWLSDDKEYAKEYTLECEEGHLYEFDIDMSNFKEFDWYFNAPDWFEPIDGFSEEEQSKLMKEGYNGYTFPASNGETILCLFDPSLIVNVREIPINNTIEESTELVDYMQIISNATVENIDFIEGEENEYGEEVFLSVNGIQIPKEIVNLTFRPIYKRFPKGKMQLLNIDIILDPSTRGKGLGTKIYAKAVKEFGAICSRFSTRHNDDGIRGIFSKLNSFGDIYATEDVYENFEGETISDYYAILKSQLDNYI